MPYRLYWDGRGLIKELSGFVSGGEFMASAEASTAHPEFLRARYVLNDFSQVSGHAIDQITTEYVAALRLGAASESPQLRVVYISTDPAIWRLVERLNTPPYHCPWPTRAFPTREEASWWLVSAGTGGNPEGREWI